MNPHDRKFRRLFPLFIAAFFLVTASRAADEGDTRYVAKQARVALLESPAPESVILARLTPDETVTVLGESEGYVNVRTVSGMEGWLNANDVSTDVPAAERLGTAQTRIAELESTIASLQRQLRNAQAQARQASATLDDRQQGAQAEVERLQVELQQARAEAETLRNNNSELQASIADYELAEQSRQLLADTRPVDQADSLLRQFDLPIALGIAAFFLLVGFITGYQVKARRIRRRFHGMNV